MINSNKYGYLVFIFLNFVFAFFLSNQASAQHSNQNLKTRILFVFDGSNSMNGVWNDAIKIDIARAKMIELVDSLSQIDNLQMALRIYGHQSKYPPQDCEDTRLEVPFYDDNSDRIIEKLTNMRPKGTTPIAYSLEQAADDFPYCKNCRDIIILITDGIEECNGDPCAVAVKLMEGGISLRPFVIGIGLDVETIEAFKCLGHYFDAQDETAFDEVLNVVVKEALVTTTAEVDLLDIYEKPTVSNVNITFIETETNRIKHNFIHTLNVLGNPDTLILDHMPTYDVIVHTIPPIKINNVELEAGKHNKITANAAQGTLVVKQKNGMELKNIELIVRKENSPNTLNVQRFNIPERYLIGKYDIEVLSLPRIYFKSVDIKYNKATELEIPQPGTVTLQMPAKGYGGVYHVSKDGIRWIANLNNKTREVLNLQPGRYYGVYRSARVKETLMSVSKEIIVEPGNSYYIQF